MTRSFKSLILGSTMAVTAALPLSAVGAAEVRTRVIDCDSGSCLLITGERTDPAATVKVNGRTVTTSGNRTWRTSIPLRAVRDWSEPYARSITVAVDGTEREVDLPIGLRGIATDLSFLIVRVI